MSGLPFDGHGVGTILTPIPFPVFPTFEDPSLSSNSLPTLSPEIVQNPHVQKLLAGLQTTTQELAQAKSKLVSAQYEAFSWHLKAFQSQYEQRKLHDTLEALRKENQRLKDELETHQLVALAVKEAHKQPLTPGDAISRTQAHSDTFTPRLVSVRSSIRPIHIPFEALWNLEDCCKDSHIMLQSTNPSHPPMEFVLRKKDGSLISAERYAIILADTVAVVSACLCLVPYPIKDPSQHGPSMDGLRLRCLSRFKHIYRKEVADAIHKLESIHEELNLCGGHWKAEHTLMAGVNVLEQRMAETQSTPPPPSHTSPSPLHPPQPSAVPLHVTENAPLAISVHQLPPSNPRQAESLNTNVSKRPRTDLIDMATGATKRLRTMGTENSSSKEPERSVTVRPAEAPIPAADKETHPATAPAPKALAGGSLASSSAPTPNPKPLNKSLQTLLVSDLRHWIQAHAIRLPHRALNKSDLINAILSSSHIPSKDKIREMVSQQRRHRKVRSRIRLL